MSDKEYIRSLRDELYKEKHSKNLAIAVACIIFAFFAPIPVIDIVVGAIGSKFIHGARQIKNGSPVVLCWILWGVAMIRSFVFLVILATR